MERRESSDAAIAAAQGRDRGDRTAGKHRTPEVTCAHTCHSRTSNGPRTLLLQGEAEGTSGRGGYISPGLLYMFRNEASWPLSLSTGRFA